MKIQVRLGFSLIELLTVVSITAIISLVSVAVLINTQIRGTKTSTIAKVRQEGEYVNEEISFVLRNAKYLLPNQDGQTCNEDMTAIKVLTKEDLVVEIYTDDDGRIASQAGGLVAEDASAYLTSSGVKLISALTFHCTQEPYQKGALIDFTFTLATGDKSVLSKESYYEQVFTNSVYMRSYQ
jgi:prepilin-type N-terminal cleavage/methylation domain-containing protein